MINKKGLTLTQALAALVILSIAIASFTSIIYTQVKSIKAVNDDILYSFYLNDINTYSYEIVNEIIDLDKYDLHEESLTAIQVFEVNNRSVTTDFYTNRIRNINGNKKEVNQITSDLITDYYVEAPSKQVPLDNFYFVYFEYGNISTLENYIESLGFTEKEKQSIFSDINTFKTAISSETELDYTYKKYICLFTTTEENGYALIKEGPGNE